MKSVIFNKQQSLSTTSSPATSHNDKENITEGTKCLGNYIREETNKISSPFDIYTASNDKHIDVDEWTKQVKKGAAKNITQIDKNEAIINRNNSFDIPSDYRDVDPTGTKLMEMINRNNMSASQAENEAKTTAFDKANISSLQEAEKFLVLYVC
jgi:hypothetical protein